MLYSSSVRLRTDMQTLLIPYASEFVMEYNVIQSIE